MRTSSQSGTRKQRRARRSAAAGIAVAGLLLAACGSDQAEPPADEASASGTAQDTTAQDTTAQDTTAQDSTAPDAATTTAAADGAGAHTGGTATVSIDGQEQNFVGGEVSCLPAADHVQLVASSADRMLNLTVLVSADSHEVTSFTFMGNGHWLLSELGAEPAAEPGLTATVDGDSYAITGEAKTVDPDAAAEVKSARVDVKIACKAA